MTNPKRIENDFLGHIEIPNIAYFGIHTARTVENLSISGVRHPLELSMAMVQVKKACAQANIELENIPVSKGNAIIKACDIILAGAHSSQFISDVFCGGGGALFNINVNEVIANCAIESMGGAKGDYSMISPFTDVNMSQGDFDVFSSAARLAIITQSQKLVHALNEMKSAFLKKSLEFDFILKAGRTSNRDSVPITLGQEFLTFAEIIKKSAEDIERARERLYFVPLGGGDTGNGTNTHKSFQDSALAHLCDITRLPVKKSENSVELTSFSYDFTLYSSNLKNLSTCLIKICSDLSLMSSGPRTGLSEIFIPETQISSSCIPGKSSPLIPETLLSASIHAISADTAASLAAALGPQNQSVYLPVMIHGLLFCQKILTGAISVFTTKCIPGITANEKKLMEYFENGAGMAALIINKTGFESAGDIAREASATGKSVLQICSERGLFTAEELADMRSPRRITEPGIQFK